MFKPVSSQINFIRLENELLRDWYEGGIVDKYLHKNDSSEETFSFLDGPITANNPMGVHHAWGRTYKDFWQRFWNMKGKKQRFQNGFDEQGLWVEVEVEKELGLRSKKDIETLVSGDKFKSLEKFIDLCKERVKKFSEIQTEQSKRLGYFMDWDNSYHTSSDKNNYTIWNFIKKVNEKGWLYKGHDAVPWCPRCGTAISQHEILTEEYKEITHETIYFKLPITNKPNEFLLVWTTTPWTIPANVAVAVNGKETYGKYEDTRGNYVWVMKKRSQALIKKGILSSRQLLGKETLGTSLVGYKYEGPFDSLPSVKKTFGDYVHRVIDGGDVVTETEGTGLLHVAPGAGEEDFKLGKKNDLPILSLIEEDATYISGMNEFTGKSAKKHPELIINFLKEKDNGLFIHSTEKYAHRYPTCWRCKSELVWRVVDEWYIAMDTPDLNRATYREQMIEVAKRIKWMPEWGLDRELDWLKNLHDWLISKKRYWGLALPIWECKDCGTFEVIGGRDELKDKAVEGWEKFDGNSPHRPWIDQIKIKCSKCGKKISRIPDVGNPWLDAGIVPFSTMPSNWFPADFITESFPGQFKNWFYSLIAMSTVLERTNSFKRVLGFGSVRDEKGEEMHKSKGNSLEFNESADKIGVDAMRWLYLRTNPEHNVNFGIHVTNEIRRMIILKYWNVYSFLVMYSNLYEWSPKKEVRDSYSSNTFDRWIISRMNKSLKNLTEKGIEQYKAYEAVKDAEIFIDDLSNWYVRGNRERINSSDKKGRSEALQTLWEVLTEYTKALAPFIPFVSEEIYRNLTSEESVHLADWPDADESLIDENLEEEMSFARQIVEVAHAKRKEAGMKVRQPLKKITYTSSKKLNSEIEKIIADELNVKEVVYEKSEVKATDESGFKVNLDTHLTPELEAEGEFRDLIRKIQDERKKLGTGLNERIDVFLPAWPESFTEEMKKRALIDNLSMGEFKVTRKNA